MSTIGVSALLVVAKLDVVLLVTDSMVLGLVAGASVLVELDFCVLWLWLFSALKAFLTTFLFIFSVSPSISMSLKLCSPFVRPIEKLVCVPRLIFL